MTTHGHRPAGKRTPTYGTWGAMRQRCLNPNHKHYSYYGGRGIKICKRWDSFANFLADMGERPDGHTLERRKNHLGYSKANCFWATKTEQQNNTRFNRLIAAFGEIKSASDWARDSRCVVVRHVLYYRLSTGMEPELAMTKPKGRYRV